MKDRRTKMASFLKNFIVLFEIALYLLSLICFVCFLSLGLKAKAVKCIFIVLLLLAYRFTQIAFNIRIHDALKLTVLLFIFLAMFLAETLNFYSRVPIYDKILHSFSGVMLFFLGQSLFKRMENSENHHPINTKLMIFFSLFFSIAMAGCWEIFEFSLDRLMGYHLQKNSLFDTMGDIICGTSAAVISAALTFVLFIAKKPKMTVKGEADELEEEVPEIFSVP